MIGAGSMGRGIAQVAAAAGIGVELADSVQGAARAGVEFAAAMLRRSAEKRQLTEADAEAAIRRLEAINDPTAPGADIDLAIEAITEELAAKQTLFARLEERLPQAILASNTSSLSITEIGAALQDPSRLVGVHFFNPVPLMRLVEVVPGLRTNPEVVDRAASFGERLGHRVLRVSDSPGFLVNHLGRALSTEALALLGEQIATPPDIDALVRDGLGLAMGPFALMDLTGLDISHTVMEGVWSRFFGDPRLRPSALAATRVSARLFGRKTGQGFYRYPGDALGDAAVDAAHYRGPELSLHVRGLDSLADRLRCNGVTVSAEPHPDGVHVVAPLGEPAYRAVLRAGLDPARSIGIDPLTVDSGHLAVVVPVTLAPALGVGLVATLQRAGQKVVVTADGPAPVVQRIVATIVNLGCSIAEQAIATPADIDAGARAALGYPHGPLEWGDLLGARRVLSILDGLHEYTRDPRYRASGWLRARADLGLSLLDSGTSLAGFRT